MFVNVFIDLENLEKTAKKELGAVLNYDEFVRVIRKIATSNGSQLVGIDAYGDFDTGKAGEMTKLINLGVEPKHVVTKSPQEYLKGSVDIELSLDVLETMYRYPHISEYIFLSGDSDLRYVIKKLQKQGKKIRLMGFKQYTGKALIDMVSEFVLLDDFPDILRKVTQSEKENMALSLMADENVNIIVKHLDRLEKMDDGRFIGLNNLRKRIIERYKDTATQMSDAITQCIDCEILLLYPVPNPNDTDHPTSACKLNRENKTVKYILGI